MRDQVRVLPYEEVLRGGPVSDGAYIFAGTDRLSRPLQALASELQALLAAQGDRVRILNQPDLTIRRLELLQMLNRSGQSRFRAYRVTENVIPERFPVFLRLESDHTGSLTDLLWTQEEVNDAIASVTPEIVADRYQASDLLMVEFLDTSDAAGIFRFYGAHVVGDRIIPRFIVFSRGWAVKFPDIVDDANVAEEWRFVRENPHQEELLEISARARVQYGRFDYTMSEGKVQVWELNTNPTLGKPRKRYHEIRRPLMDHFAEAFGSALLELARAHPTRQQYAFTPTPALVRRSMQPEHQPPVSFKPPWLAEKLLEPLPPALRKSLRRVARAVAR